NWAAAQATIRCGSDVSNIEFSVERSSSSVASSITALGNTSFQDANHREHGGHGDRREKCEGKYWFPKRESQSNLFFSVLSVLSVSSVPSVVVFLIPPSAASPRDQPGRRRTRGGCGGRGRFPARCPFCWC